MDLTHISGYLVRNQAPVEDSTTYFYANGYFLNELSRGGLTIPHDGICQWTYFCYILFQEICDNVCITSLVNMFLLISSTYRFKAGKREAIVLSNILLNNYSKLITPRSSKESSQKIIKLSTQN